jgi:hypothetical protein
LATLGVKLIGALTMHSVAIGMKDMSIKVLKNAGDAELNKKLNGLIAQCIGIQLNKIMKIIV